MHFFTTDGGDLVRQDPLCRSLISDKWICHLTFTQLLPELEEDGVLRRLLDSFADALLLHVDVAFPVPLAAFDD